MNSETLLATEQIAKDAGAIIPCSTCGNYYLRVWDEEAERMTYARATNACKSHERGFRSMTFSDVRSLVKSFLDSALHRCPSCDFDG